MPMTPSTLLARGWAVSRAFTVLTLVHVVAVPAFVIAGVADPSTIDGAPTWAKPLKFGLSFLALGPAMLWVYAHVRRTRAIRVMLETAGTTMLVEAVLITAQAARGRASHFNNETALDAAVFTVMGAGVGIFTLAVAGAGLLLARTHLGDGALAFSMKLAVPIMLGGAMVGFLMPGFKPGQTEDSPRIGAHSVGGHDGGGGLTLLGWSTEHGDLRVAHFVGLHALQVLPLVALIITYLGAAHRLHLSSRRQRAAVGLVAVAWVGLVFTALVQALRGQAVVAPDAVTWVMVTGLAVVPVCAAALVLASGVGSGRASAKSVQPGEPPRTAASVPVGP